MTLYETISNDVKTAMKSGDQARVEVLRFALSGLQGALKEKTVKDPTATLSDEEAAAVLQKEAKRRKESIELFKQGNRADLAAKEETELAILSAYLPKQMPREEIEKLVEELKAQGFNEFNTLMREAMKTAKGKADGKLVGEVVKEKLG
jgi:uncharacterized protein YqeY